MKAKDLTLLIVPAMLLSCSSKQEKISYPETPTVDSTDVYFGTRVSDPYRWLENDTSAATAAWVQAQNRVTADYLSHIPFRRDLAKRFGEVYNYEKASAPFKRHGKYYFFKNDGLQNQSVLYVQDALDAEPRVFFDPNRLSDDGTVALTGIQFSKDGRHLAYTVSRSGSDWSEIYVMDVQTGKLLGDSLRWVKFGGPAWKGDGFYYSAYDAPDEGKAYSNINENHKVYYHKLGTPAGNRPLGLSEPQVPQAFLHGLDRRRRDLPLPL